MELFFIGFFIELRNSKDTATILKALARSGEVKIFPLSISAWGIPLMFMAALCPAVIAVTSLKWLCIPLIFTFLGIRCFFDIIITSSFFFTLPEATVPVTTVPTPLIENERSIGSRKKSPSGFDQTF